MSVDERSISRGRQAFQSSGRGGAGNIRQPSVSKDARPESGPDDFSQTRGREPIRISTQIFSTGRGGAGNMRSPSRDNQKVPTIEEDVIREYKKSQQGSPISSGRGGLGNISRSRTRDSATIPIVHSTGRDGGAGNGSVSESIHEDDIKGKEHLSTGRGGNTNTTTMLELPIERHQHIGDGHQSTGHGGTGKTVKETT